MKTTNYAIVTVLNDPEARGWGSRHYTEVRTYEYLEDAKYDYKYDAVEVYQEADEVMNRHKPEDEPKRVDYHLEVVKLSWEGNFSQVSKSYTNWIN